MSDKAEEGNDQKAEVYRRPLGTSGWHDGEEEDRISLVEVANVLLRHRCKVIGLPVLAAIVTVTVTLAWPSRYTSTTSFMGQDRSQVSGQLSQMAGLASQFGIDIPGGATGRSPQFYADLLTSRRLLEEAVTTEYAPSASDANGGLDLPRFSSPDGKDGEMGGTQTDSGDTSNRTLIELYDIEEPTRGRAIAEAARELEEAVSVSTNLETGVVELAVTTAWPTISKQVADRLIKLVNDFNNRVRQTQASAEAEFVGARLEEVRTELRAAEDSLESFMEKNVAWQQSPELRFEYDRLQRRVSRKQQVYTSLATRYEEARISEVKSTPVVTSVTRPQVPVEPDSGNIPLKIVLGLVGGGIVGLIWAFGSEFGERLREEDAQDYRKYLALKRDAADDLRRAGRRIRRLVERGSGDDAD